MNDSTLELSNSDWERLRAMRTSFLSQIDATTTLPDYWNSTRDLEIYDATFGARIAWKWNAVLGEIARRGVEIPHGPVLDWGAGTGIAGRAFLRHFGTKERSVSFLDRSRAAVQFAERKTREEFSDVVIVPPAVAATSSSTSASEPKSGGTGVMLASHVIDELDDAGRAEFVARARTAQLLIWVESGAKTTSRALSSVRDALLDDLDPLLPCTHRSTCGVLAEARANDWCHHFAPPAPDAFTTLFWRTFSRTLSIDMRSLPYSYLVARRRESERRYDADVVRVIGTPRLDKGRATLTVCGTDGLRESMLLERLDRPRFKTLEKGTAERRLAIHEKNGRIERIETR